MKSIDTETLRDIVGSDIPPEPSFLTEKKFKCKHNDGFSTDSLPELMTHYRTEHRDDNKMIEDTTDEIVPAIVPARPTDTDADTEVCEECGAEFHGKMAKAQLGRHKSAKHGIKSIDPKEKPLAEIPTDYDRLASILKSFGVSHWSGIIEGMKLRDINDTVALRNYLISVSCPQVKTDAIVKMWAEVQGLKVPQRIEEIKPATRDPFEDLLSTQERMLRMKMMENMLGTKTTNTENSEVATLKSEINSLKEMLLKQKADDELKNLKQQMEQMKKDSESDNGSLAGMLRQYITEQDHKWQMFQKDQEYSKELSALREQLQINNSKPLTEKLVDKLDNTLGGLGAGVGAIAQENIRNERMALVSNLIHQGVDPQTAAAMAGLNRGVAANASELEYLKMQRALERSEKAVAETQKQASAVDVPPTKPATPTPSTEVKFNGGD